MFSDYGRMKVESIEKTNLIGFRDKKIHIYEMWYLVSINGKWLGVNNSGKKFTQESFDTKEELITYFENKKDIEGFQKYFLNCDYYGSNSFKKTLEFVAWEYEKQYGVKVGLITDCVFGDIIIRNIIKEKVYT